MPQKNLKISLLSIGLINLLPIQLEGYMKTNYKKAVKSNYILDMFNAGSTHSKNTLKLTFFS